MAETHFRGSARLDRQNRPGILYATGNGTQIPLTKTDGEACLAKPYRPEDIVAALQIVQQVMSTCHTSRPFPRGFNLLSPHPADDAASVPANIEAAGIIARLRKQQAELARFGSFALGEQDLHKILTEAARAMEESR